MAEAKKIERSYTIPLRREFLKVPKYKRAKKATAAVKQFLAKHMKSQEIKVGTSINEKVWENGMKNPPSKVRVQAVRDEKGVVSCELFGTKKETDKKTPAKKVQPEIQKKEEVKTEEKKVEAAPKAK